MRISSVARIGRTVWESDVPISGKALLDAISATFAAERLQSFDVLFDPHFIDTRILTRPRMIHNLGYGYMLVKDFKKCTPVVVDPSGDYNRILIAIDHWGENFRIQAHNQSFLGLRRRELSTIALEMVSHLPPPTRSTN